jgi:bifunctional non-homologous end joining protein LigD
MARRRQAPVSFAVFDVLYLDGESLLQRPYVERRRLLEEELELRGDAWCVVPSFVDELRVVFEHAERIGLEGLVAKRLDSTYRPGTRSIHWLKVKTVDWRANHAPLRHER